MNPHLQRALVLIQQSRLELAEQELHQALTEDPQDGQAHAALALCLSDLKRHRDALTEADTAIGLAPEVPFTHFARSCVLYEQNRYPEALHSIEEAIGLNPYVAEYFAQQAAIHHDQRQWQQALEAAEQGLQLDPEDVGCTNMRAVALRQLGRHDQAGDAIETALKRSPEDETSHANMGWTLLSQGDPERAMLSFREALRLNPESEWARAGIVEAMKARYAVYRIMLNWFLWMGRLSGRAQWGIILGGYAGYQVLRVTAAENPRLAPWIMPLLIAYVVFAMMTWMAGPLFDLLLRLNRFGRLALSREQTRTSTLIGLCVLGVLGFVVAFFVTGLTEFLYSALVCVLMIPALGRLYHCDEGWPRAAMWLILIALAGLGSIVITGTVVQVLSTGRLALAAETIGGGTFVVFVVGALISQFAVNYLASVRPRRGTSAALRTWLIGGGILGVGALLWAALAGLVGFYFLGPQSSSINLVPEPIRAHLEPRDDLEWDDVEGVRAETGRLRELGLIPSGDFLIRDFEGARLRLMLHPEKAVLARIFEAPTADLQVELSTLYDDGSVFGYYSGLPTMLATPDNVTVHFLDATADVLHDRLLAERPPQGIRPVAAEECAALYEAYYARQMDFLLARGGPTADEIRAMAESGSGRTVDDERIEAIRKLWRRQASSKVEAFVLDRFLFAPPAGIPADVDRERLLCIHDLLDADRVVMQYLVLSTENRDAETDLDAVDALLEAHPPREAFARMITVFDGVRKVGEAREPIACDIYLRAAR